MAERAEEFGLSTWTPAINIYEYSGVPVVGNTCRYAKAPWVLGGFPRDQENLDPGGIWTHDLRIRSIDASAAWTLRTKTKQSMANWSSIC